jgi:hypothetical protein
MTVLWATTLLASMVPVAIAVSVLMSRLIAFSPLKIRFPR